MTDIGGHTMKSWREDPRFHCLDCHKPIRIVMASSNRLSDTTPDAFAYCPRCDRFFEAKEWRGEPWKNNGLSDVPF